MGSAIRAADMPPHIRSRYGLDRSPWPRRAIVGTLLAGYAAAAAWVAFELEDTPVESQLLVWQQVERDRVDITYEVRRSADTEVTCVLRSQDFARTDVGYADVVLEPGTEYVQQTYSMRVLGAAAIAEVLDCQPSGERLNTPGPQFPPGIAAPQQPWSPAAP